jgi:acetyl-CoA carboxylase biotin carboxyl carrier protein
MTIEEIKELLDVFNASGVGELELQRGDDRIRIRKAGQPGDYPAPVAPAPPVQTVEAPGAAEIQAAADASQVLVKSPIVGTYYDASSPDSAPFVKVGDTVEPGQVLCIIESMKLMNEIEAEIGGVIVSKLVPNAQPVEYGEALFAIRPV